MLNILLNNQHYLIYLASVMISVGIIKQYHLFEGLYQWLIRKLRSKKLLVVLISAISGVLPIPGRVVVSAGILDTLAVQDDASRKKYGILDYLSTHHYYLWSPLEKTIILPMSVLGLTYLGTLKLLFPLLIISISVLLWYVIFKIDNSDIEITVAKIQIKPVRFVRNILPLILSVSLLIFRYNPAIVFSALALYYILMSKERSLKKIISFVNFKLVGFLASMIIISNFIKMHSNQFNNIVSSLNSLSLVLIFLFVFSFLMGSSGKFSGLVSLLSLVFGIEYFMLFTAIAFSAYLMSPTHKCVSIGKMYFKTPLRDYYAVIGVWCGIMVFFSLITMLIGGIV